MSITKYHIVALAIPLVPFVAFLSSGPSRQFGGEPIAFDVAMAEEKSPASQSPPRSAPPSSQIAATKNVAANLAPPIASQAGLPPLDELVQQKYSILFSALELSPQTRAQLSDFLREREVIAGRSFYDARSNAAEVAESLRQRELAVAEVDKRIAQFLTAEDAKKYTLLKDSTYEQALLNGFYQVSGMDALPEQQKLTVLLGKLEQKQKLAELVTVASEQIANAAPATKNFFIEKTRKAFVAEQEEFLLAAKAGLSDEQFELLRQYEQQLSAERWQDLMSGWQ